MELFFTIQDILNKGGCIAEVQPFLDRQIFEKLKPYISYYCIGALRLDIFYPGNFTSLN